MQQSLHASCIIHSTFHILIMLLFIMNFFALFLDGMPILTNHTQYMGYYVKKMCWNATKIDQMQNSSPNSIYSLRYRAHLFLWIAPHHHRNSKRMSYCYSRISTLFDFWQIEISTFGQLLPLNSHLHLVSFVTSIDAHDIYIILLACCIIYRSLSPKSSTKSPLIFINIFSFEKNPQNPTCHLT